jgi:hypothetical protein
VNIVARINYNPQREERNETLELGFPSESDGDAFGGLVE